MTTPTNTHRTHPTIRATPAGTLLITHGNDTIELPLTTADELTDTLRDAVFTHAPELTRVIGNDTGDGLHVLAGDNRNADHAESQPITHGLACPWPDCGHIAWHDHDWGVAVIDADERWSTFSYQHTDDGETVTGSYADTDYQGLGYRCLGCARPVTLPAGIIEEGD